MGEIVLALFHKNKKNMKQKREKKRKNITELKIVILEEQC